MKKSHIIFVVVCVVWLGGRLIFLLVSEPDLIERYGVSYLLGYTLTEFLILAVGYCVYLFIQRQRAKTLKN